LPFCICKFITIFNVPAFFLAGGTPFGGWHLFCRNQICQQDSGNFVGQLAIRLMKQFKTNSMKTILVPTDFSEIADNAINYAAELGKLMSAKLILFNAYHMPIITSEVPVVMPTAEEIETDCMIGLKKIEEELQKKHNNQLQISASCRYGLAVDEISAFAAESNVDLIVIGMRGAGFLSEKLIGSVTTSLMRKVKCPLLVIDEHVTYKEIKKVALASDYHEIQHESALQPLKEFVRLFNAHIHVLNVVKEKAELVPTTEQAVVGVKLEHSLEGVDHTFHYTENKNVVEGINQYVAENNIDMVVMIPRIHSVLTNIFREPHTKRMAFHSTVPLLILNDL
jgi:nucleotide-binding universal stress UspA family protein